jgi:hypothetical protein
MSLGNARERWDDEHERPRDKHGDEKQANLEWNGRYRLAIFAPALRTIGLNIGIHIQMTPS